MRHLLCPLALAAVVLGPVRADDPPPPEPTHEDAVAAKNTAESHRAATEKERSDAATLFSQLDNFYPDVWIKWTRNHDAIETTLSYEDYFTVQDYLAGVPDQFDAGQDYWDEAECHHMAAEQAFDNGTANLGAMLWGNAVAAFADAATYYAAAYWRYFDAKTAWDQAIYDTSYANNILFNHGF